MRTSIYYIFISIVIFSCQKKREPYSLDLVSKNEFNITEKVVSELEWMNHPKSFLVNNNSLHITVGKGTDFFNNPEDGAAVGTAPYLHKIVTGDFVAKALVQPDFSSQWNAAALMVHLDSLNWIKFAFENSDATGPSIVSVVTRGTSDDANGVILNDEHMVWLAIARKGNIYSMHWSVDGENYNMTRLTSMPNQDSVKIGLEAQSPAGDSATHQIHFFEVKKRTVANLRKVN